MTEMPRVEIEIFSDGIEVAVKTEGVILEVRDLRQNATTTFTPEEIVRDGFVTTPLIDEIIRQHREIADFDPCQEPFRYLDGPAVQAWREGAPTLAPEDRAASRSTREAYRQAPHQESWVWTVEPDGTLFPIPHSPRLFYYAPRYEIAVGEQGEWNHQPCFDQTPEHGWCQGFLQTQFHPRAETTVYSRTLVTPQDSCEQYVDYSYQDGLFHGQTLNDHQNYTFRLATLQTALTFADYDWSRLVR